MRAVLDGGVRVAAAHVLVSKKVAALVQARRALGHGLRRIAHRRQHLVFNLDERLCLGENLRRFRGHKADGIAKIARFAAHRDEHVPVLDQVPHDVQARNILRREHADNARERAGFFRMDGEHPCAGVPAAHGAAVNHALISQIVRILAVAQHLFAHIQPVYPRPHLPGGFLGGNLALAQQARGDFDRLDDLHIARAAADVVAQRMADFFLRGIGVCIQQGLGGDHHAGNAEAALHGACLAEGKGINVLFKVRKPFHGENVPALQLVRLLNAGLDRLAVDEHGAGAAGALRAAVLHGGQAQRIAKVAHEALVVFHRNGFAVDKKAGHPSFSPYLYGSGLRFSERGKNCRALESGRRGGRPLRRGELRRATAGSCSRSQRRTESAPGPDPVPPAGRGRSCAQPRPYAAGSDGRPDGRNRDCRSRRIPSPWRTA